MNVPAPGLAPLYGLVLAGGASRRMGRDKATLDYHGQPQVRWTHALLARHCERAFVSVRTDQRDDPARAGLPQIADVHEGLGPIAGIAAAQAAFPQAAWLVVACDLPFLDDALLALLVRERGLYPVTAFRSAHDGLPEPLCAIYEPETRPGVLEAIARDRRCPRKFVIGTGVPLLDQPDPAALDNVNTPEELAAVERQLGHGATGVRP
jgi:molybdopterin-guanine dinucleotide biosynthesis protein A